MFTPHGNRRAAGRRQEAGVRLPPPFINHHGGGSAWQHCATLNCITQKVEWEMSQEMCWGWDIIEAKISKEGTRERLSWRNEAWMLHQQHFLWDKRLYLDTSQRRRWDTSLTWDLRNILRYRVKYGWLPASHLPTDSNPITSRRGPALSEADLQLPTTLSSIICGSMCRLPSMPLTVSEVSLWLHHRLALNLIKKKEKGNKKDCPGTKSVQSTKAAAGFRPYCIVWRLDEKEDVFPLIFFSSKKKKKDGWWEKKMPGIHLVNTWATEQPPKCARTHTNPPPTPSLEKSSAVTTTRSSNTGLMGRHDGEQSVEKIVPQIVRAVTSAPR